MKLPKKWKTAIVIWLAIYPLITLISALFDTHLARIEFLPLRTLVVTVVVVPVMVYILIPNLQKLLSGWLQK